MSFNQSEVDQYYRKALKEGKGLFGSELSGQVRLDSIMAQMPKDMSSKTLLDVGCGDGVLLDVLSSYSDANFDYPRMPRKYVGTDVLTEVIKQARDKWEDEEPWERSDVSFEQLDYSRDNHLDKEEWDYIIAISVFDRKFGDITSSKQYAWQLTEKMIRNAKIMAGITFLSAYKTINDPGELLFTPEEVLSFARQLTERVMIDYSYAPQAFTLFTWNEPSEFRKMWTKEGGYK